MKKFNLKYLCEVAVVVNAETTDDAATIAKLTLAQFPRESQAKVLSIYAEDYVEPPRPTSPPRGRPIGGGSPGTPVVRHPALDELKVALGL